MPALSDETYIAVYKAVRRVEDEYAETDAEARKVMEEFNRAIAAVHERYDRRLRRLNERLGKLGDEKHDLIYGTDGMWREWKRIAALIEDVEDDQ